MSEDAGSVQARFDEHRLHILSTAVGIARSRLGRGDAGGALEALDGAADETRSLHRELLAELGHPAEQVESFLGGRLSAGRKRGVVRLEAFVDVDEAHDVERFLGHVREAFANRFSCYVHEFYPDAAVRCDVVVERP